MSTPPPPIDTITLSTPRSTYIYDFRPLAALKLSREQQGNATAAGCTHACRFRLPVPRWISGAAEAAGYRAHVLGRSQGPTETIGLTPLAPAPAGSEVTP